MPLSEQGNKKARERHAWRMANDPEYKERRRQYAATQNDKRSGTEARKEYDRKRYPKRMADPKYVAKRSASAKERARKKLQECPEEVRASKRKYQAVRRARKYNAFVEVVDAELVLMLSGAHCGICQEYIKGPFQVDHIVPLSKGGKHSYANCQATHPACNQRKGNKCPQI